MTYAAVAIGGLVTSFFGKKKEKEGVRKQSEASIRAENARERQMELEGIRSQREVMRRAMVARSTANVAASSKGAFASSGIQGGYGQISNAGARQVNEIQQNLSVGRDIFAANRDLARAQTTTAEGKATYGLGMDIFKSAEPIAKVGVSTIGGIRNAFGGQS